MQSVCVNLMAIPDLLQCMKIAYLVKNVGVALCLIVEILFVSGLEHCILAFLAFSDFGVL